MVFGFIIRVEGRYVTIPKISILGRNTTEGTGPPALILLGLRDLLIYGSIAMFIFFADFVNKSAASLYRLYRLMYTALVMCFALRVPISVSGLCGLIMSGL